MEKTQKTLLLMRHAQADTNLTLTGRKQADDVARQIVESELLPDVILHSPVTRALETAQRLRDVFKASTGRDIPLVPSRALDLDSFIKPGNALHEIDSAHKTVLMVTHQPKFEMLARKFGYSASPENTETHVLREKAANWQDFSKPVIAGRIRPF